MKKQCEICGKEFEALRRKKTCSDECARKLRKEYRTQWLRNHPDYMKNYFQKNRERYSRSARRARKEAKLEQANLSEPCK